jgi:hypothetical protein
MKSIVAFALGLVMAAIPRDMAASSTSTIYSFGTIEICKWRTWMMCWRNWNEGVDVDPKLESYDYGKFGWIMDPEGNRVELWEPPPS